MNGTKEKSRSITVEMICEILGICSVVLLIVALPIFRVNLDEEWISYFNNILIGLAVGFAGIIVTITAVQKALENQAIKNEKIEEYKKILRYSKYAKVLISKYILYFNYVVTPENKLQKMPTDNFCNDFILSDLKDIYKLNVLLTEPLNTPIVFGFFNIEKELYDYFLRMNEEIDFKYSNELSVMLNEYFKNTNEYDSRNSIIGWYKDEQYRVIAYNMCDMLNKYPERDFEKEFDENDESLSSNSITQIIMLFKLMKFQKVGIEKYLAIVEKIEESLMELE